MVNLQGRAHVSRAPPRVPSRTAGAPMGRGTSLRSATERGGLLAVLALADLGARCQGLGHEHARHVVARELQPGTLLDLDLGVERVSRRLIHAVGDGYVARIVDRGASHRNGLYVVSRIHENKLPSPVVIVNNNFG